MTPEDLDDVDACVFDCDGTLIDTMGLFYAADVKACEEVGVALKVAPLLPPGQWHRPRPPQKPRTIDFSKVDLTFLGGYPALP